jgi:hypothetical protein
MSNVESKSVSRSIFAVSVIVLVVLAAVGFGLYATKQAVTYTVTTAMGASTMTEMSSATMAETGVTSSEMASSGSFGFAGPFMAQSGAMIGNSWLVVSSLGNGEYAVVVHAEGLEPNGDYIVEGPVTTGSMQTAPISTLSMMMNTTAASEFTADSHGTGTFWIVLNSNPTTAFEAIQLYYLPGMSMQNAMLVATVKFPMMSG